MGPSLELAALRQAERDAALDDILSRWWSSLTPARLADGHSHSAPGLEDYRASRQYDSEAIDDAFQRDRMAKVGYEVSCLADPWRSAINALARSLCTGAAVFHSPRIAPADRTRVTAEARRMLWVRLVDAGLLSDA